MWGSGAFVKVDEVVERSMGRKDVCFGLGEYVGIVVIRIRDVSEEVFELLGSEGRKVGGLGLWRRREGVSV
jgi:hypothetical protein